MAELLRDPIWQGIGVFVALLLGLAGFYITRPHRLWIYVSGAAVMLLAATWIFTAFASRTTLEFEELFAEPRGYQFPGETTEFTRLFDFHYEKSPPCKSRLRLAYSFPEPPRTEITVGVSIPLRESIDISSYAAIEVTLRASKGSDVNFIIHSDSGHKQFSRIVVGTNESQNISIPTKQIADALNTKAIAGFYATSSTRSEPAKGIHSFVVSNIRAVKK